MFFLLNIFLLSLSSAITCPTDKIEVSATRVYSSQAAEESFYLYQGNSTSSSDLAYKMDSGQTIGTQTGEFCLSPGLVTLVMKDTYGDGWYTGSHLLLIAEGRTFGPYSIAYHSGSVIYHEETLSFYIFSYVNYGEEWQFSSEPQTTTDWRTNPVQWNEQSSYPAVSTVTRYFRKEFVMDTSVSAFGVSLSVKTNSGFVAYLNGHRVFSWGMPDGEIISSTYAIQQSITTERTFTTLLSLVGIQSFSTLIIAIEMHAHQSTMNINECFDAKMVLLTGEESYRVEDGTPEGSPLGMSGETFANLYDNNVSTKWCYLHFASSPGYSTYTYSNGRRELINRYSITTANDFEIRDPTSWNFYGRQETGDWMLLDTRTNYMLPSARLSREVFDIVNYTPYNSYKIEFLTKRGTSDRYLQLSEFGFYMYNQNITVSLNYPIQSISLIRGIEEINLSPIDSVLFYSWAIQPSLPSGIQFNSTTGTISGTPTTSVPTIPFTVSAISRINHQTYTFPLSITVTTCDLPINMYVYLYKENGNLENEMYEIKNAMNETIYQHQPSSKVSIGRCLPVGKYTVRMYSTNGIAWQSASIIRIGAVIAGSEVTLVKTRLQNDSEKSFSLSLLFPLQPVELDTNYKYSIDGTIPNNWYSSTFVDSTWPTLSETSRPSSSQSVMLYRHSFSVDSLSSIHGFEINVKAKAGLLIYLNGEEVFRHNIPEGTITSATTATAGTAIAEWKTITLCASLLATNVNTLAVAIVNQVATSHVVEFDCFARLISESVSIPRYFNVMNPENTAALFDNNIATEMNLSAGTHQTASLLFDSNRFEVVNEYCFYTSTNSPINDPKDWSFRGTIDGSMWEVIDSQTNVFMENRNYQHCFFLPNQHKPYRGYQLYLNATAGGPNFILASMELFLENLPALVLPELSFEPSVITGYVNVPFSQSTVSSDYYTFFTISPSLPTGLTLNTATGGIHGSVSHVLQPTTYVISALNHLGETKSTTITLSANYCMGDRSFFIMEFYMNSQASTCSFELKELSTGRIVSERSTFINGYDISIALCSEASLYELTLRSTGTSGWGRNSVLIRLSDNSVLLKESLAAGVSEKSYKFNTVYAIAPSFSEWSYSLDGSTPPSGWNTLEGAPSSWPVSKPGEFPASASITQYYYRSFTVDNLSLYSVLEISFIVKAGVVVYLNGYELYREALPVGTLQPTMEATTESETPKQVWFGELVQRGYINVGKNILAFELHRFKTNEEANSFDGSAWFIVDGMYMMTNGLGTTKPVVTGAESSEMVFDNNSSTKTYIGNSCVNVELIFSFPENRYEVITNYGLQSANDCNNRHPSGWVLEATNNMEDWVPLHEKREQFFTSYNQQLRYSFYNQKAFNTYRLTILECGNQRLDYVYCPNGNFQLADFYLFASRIEGVCSRIDDFDPAMDGDKSYAACPKLYEGSRYRTCTDGLFSDEVNYCQPSKPESITILNPSYTFYRKTKIQPISPIIVAAEYTVTVNPELPTGLTMDSTTGIITGKPLNEQVEVVYTMTAVNVGGETSAIFSITVVKKEVNWVLMVAISVISIAVFIGIIVGIKAACKMSSKGKTKSKHYLKVKKPKPEKKTVSKVSI